MPGVTVPLPRAREDVNNVLTISTEPWATCELCHIDNLHRKLRSCFSVHTSPHHAEGAPETRHKHPAYNKLYGRACWWLCGRTWDFRSRGSRPQAVISKPGKFSFYPNCLCLLEETLKAVGPFVSMPGEIKDPTQRVDVLPVVDSQSS